MRNIQNIHKTKFKKKNKKKSNLVKNVMVFWILAAYWACTCLVVSFASIQIQKVSQENVHVKWLWQTTRDVNAIENTSTIFYGPRSPSFKWDKSILFYITHYLKIISLFQNPSSFFLSTALFSCLFTYKEIINLIVLDSLTIYFIFLYEMEISYNAK